MKHLPTTWDEVRQLSEELELKLHLAGMEARTRWQELQPEVAEIRRSLASSGQRVTAVIERQIVLLTDKLHRLRDDIASSSRD
jgi:hypothetical protein